MILYHFFVLVLKQFVATLNHRSSVESADCILKQVRVDTVQRAFAHKTLSICLGKTTAFNQRRCFKSGQSLIAMTVTKARAFHPLWMLTAR